MKTKQSGENSRYAESYEFGGSDTFCIAHTHFIPIVHVGKKRRTLIGPRCNLNRQHPLLELR